MNSKIEPGCLAVIIRSRYPGNIGKVVTVIQFVGTAVSRRGAILGGNDFWLIDKEIVTVDHFSGKPSSTTNATRESYLMRIDGYKGEEKSTSKNEELCDGRSS